MTHRTRRRLATVLLAPIAALGSWALLRLDGVDLAITTGDGTVGPVDVVTSALIGAIGGWLVVRLLERYSRRPGFWWPPIGSTALAVSTIGPSYFAVDGPTALALTVLHFVTAIVVITGFATTLPAPCDCGARRARIGDPLYVALLPPVPALERRGERAIGVCLGLLAALAGLTLALGAPRSFAVLFVYVVAVAGIALRLPAAVAVIAVGAVCGGLGLAIAGSDGSTVAAWTLTILGVGAMTTALGNAARANRELRRAREERARLAVSEERLRIARDLHDLLGQTLTLIALKTELATRLVKSDPHRAEAELREVQRATREALADVRQAVQGYRGPPFADALERARETLTAAGIDCRVDAVASGLPDEVDSVLAWAVREATTNVVRHSNARTCAITLSNDFNGVALEIEDDGAAPAPGNGDGSGLVGLAERARSLHGALDAGARPGGGFRLRLTLPGPAK